MIALSRMASRSNRPLSERLGIEDPTIAFAFDVECSEILFQAELEREAEQAKQIFEAAATGQLSGGPSAGSPPEHANKVDRW